MQWHGGELLAAFAARAFPLCALRQLPVVTSFRVDSKVGTLSGTKVSRFLNQYHPSHKERRIRNISAHTAVHATWSLITEQTRNSPGRGVAGVDMQQPSQLFPSATEQ